MPKLNTEYIVYKGEEVLVIGTLEECAEHLDNQAVMDDFNKGQYQIELRVAGEVSPNA